ncbi:MAG: zinc-ribbon domain containing protein [Pseudomonadales bacterium]
MVSEGARRGGSLGGARLGCRRRGRIFELPTPASACHGERLAIEADRAALDRINTYATLPEYYIDRPFTCRCCGKREIWRAADQKWYYEVAKGDIDARAVECHACRTGVPG